MPTLRPEPCDALLVVDVPYDWFTGSLAMPGAADELAPLDAVMAAFAPAGRSSPVQELALGRTTLVCGTGRPMAPHRVAAMSGTEFAPGLDVCSTPIDVHIATCRDAEPYSTFDGTNLNREVRGCGVNQIAIGGHAIDDCVLWTVLDARRLR